MKTASIFVLIAVLFGIGCVDREAQKQARRTEALIKDPATSVEVATVSSETVDDTLELTGSIATSDDVTVTGIVGGALIAVEVKDGDEVSAGQIIARQDPAEHQARVGSARAQWNAARSALDQAIADAEFGPGKSSAQLAASQARLDQAKSRLQRLLNGSRPEERALAEAQVQKAKSDLATAQLALDRARRLFGEGAIARAALEQAENTHASALAGYESALQNQRLTLNSAREEDVAAARQDVRAAEQQLAIDQANKGLDVLYAQRVNSAKENWTSAGQTLELAQIALNSTSIRAPFSGRVSGKPLQVGTYVGPGVEIARIVGAGGSYFEAEVPENQIALLKPGMAVAVTVDALQGATVRGTLSTIGPQATSAGRLFSARVTIVSIPEGLRSGMFARGLAVLGKRQGVHLLPSGSILRDGGKAYVFLADGAKAKRVTVSAGHAREGRTEVTGVADGDQVIVKGQATIADGSPVKVIGKPGA